MLFASIFEPAFTGLGILLALALFAALLASRDPENDPHQGEFTARWRRRS